MSARAVSPAKPAAKSGSPFPVHLRVFDIDLGPDARNDIRRRVDRRFAKFAPSISRISVRLKDVNGPRGGVDHTCRLKVMLKDLPAVIVEERDVSSELALGRALAGASRAVRRSLERRRTRPIQRHARSGPAGPRT